LRYTGSLRYAAVLGDSFEGVIDMLGGIDLLVHPDELLIVKEKACAGGFSTRMGHLEGIAERAIDVTEERKGETVFAGKGELLGHGIHRDAEGFHFGGGEFLR
jgi:hypothetical protein